MKIVIESSGFNPKIDAAAVASYLKQNTISKETQLKNSIFVNVETTINTTPPGTGEKVETDYGSFHVSCRKTPGGNYIFDVWNA